MKKLSKIVALLLAGALTMPPVHRLQRRWRQLHR